LRGKVQGRAGVVTQTVNFPVEDHRHPFLSGLWAMREMAKLLERDRLKVSMPGVGSEAKSLAQEFGFKLPASYFHATPLSPSDERELSSLLRLFKTSNIMSDVIAGGVRNVGAKVFRFGKTGWIDGANQGLLPVKTVPFLSDEYFALLRTQSELGPFLALGPEITLVWGQEVLRIHSGRPAP
jgi:hypothetical protein